MWQLSQVTGVHILYIIDGQNERIMRRSGLSVRMSHLSKT